MSTHPAIDDAPLRGGPSAPLGERPRLIKLACRFLGSPADAEDVVQETYIRWYSLPREQREAITSPGGWLTKVAGRICLDLLGSARVRRERYVGAGLPEPQPGRTEWIGGHWGATADPADHVTLDESVGMALLVVLESMTPAERVTFVLRDVFHYPFAEVAEKVGRTPAACRRLATSARRRIREGRPLPGTSTARDTGAVSDVRQAWAARDIETLIALLTPEPPATEDGRTTHPEPPPTADP